MPVLRTLPAMRSSHPGIASVDADSCGAPFDRVSNCLPYVPHGKGCASRRPSRPKNSHT